MCAALMAELKGGTTIALGIGSTITNAANEAQRKSALHTAIDIVGLQCDKETAIVHRKPTIVFSTPFFVLSRFM